MNDNGLQKLIDAKLSAMKPTAEAISNFYYDYPARNFGIAFLLRKTKISKKDFLELKFSKSKVKNAIVNSLILDDVVSKYRSAVVDGLTSPFFHDLRDEVIFMKEDEQAEDELRSYNETRKVALRKVANCGLSEEEKRILGLRE